jgi:hypothetical protein
MTRVFGREIEGSDPLKRRGGTYNRIDRTSMSPEQRGATIDLIFDRLDLQMEKLYRIRAKKLEKAPRRTDMDSTGQTISTDTMSVKPTGSTVMPLEKELGVYDAHLIDLLANEGKYVLIFGDQIGIFKSYEEALQAGYEKYGLEPFLVKQINRAEPIHYFSRDLSACRT